MVRCGVCASGTQESVKVRGWRLDAGAWRLEAGELKRTERERERERRVAPTPAEFRTDRKIEAESRHDASS